MKLKCLHWQNIDLTHRCNLHCDWCGKRTHESDYEMTVEQIDNMLKYINLATDTIRVSGGEPTMHPQFNAIMYKLLTRFAIVKIATNGTQMNRVLPALTIDPRVNFLVSYYPGIEPVDIEHIDSTPDNFYNPRHDPDLDDDTARLICQHCPYTQVKIIGDRVYNCCHAETVERIYGGVYHSIVGPDWQSELESVDRWKACRHCFIAEPQPYEPTR